LLAVGLLATLVATLFITRLARAELRKQQALAGLQPPAAQEETRR
jgi:hypothetical protein